MTGFQTLRLKFTWQERWGGEWATICNVQNERNNNGTESCGLHSGTWAKLHYYCATCRSQPYCQYYKKNFNSRFHIIRVVKFRDTTSSTKLDVLDTSFPNKYCHMYMFPIVTVIVFLCHWELPVHCVQFLASALVHENSYSHPKFAPFSTTGFSKILLP